MVVARVSLSELVERLLRQGKELLQQRPLRGVSTSVGRVMLRKRTIGSRIISSLLSSLSPS